MKKTILITGGSQRIGRSIALFLKDSNYNFIIHYNKSSKAARELKNIINGQGRDCEIVKTDLSKISDVKNIIKRSKKFFGPINAIVNNASLFINDNIENLNDKLWYDHMNINLSLIHISEPTRPR